MVRRGKIEEVLTPEEIDKISKSLNERLPWTHIKTGNLYMIHDLGFDSTNDTEGRILVLYYKLNTEDYTMYAREIKEFLTKFELNTNEPEIPNPAEEDIV